MCPLPSDVSQRKAVRVASVVVFLIIIVFVMVWARAFYGARQAYHLGESHLKGGRYLKATTYFDRSIRWYTPLNPYVYRSADRLWQIAIQAEDGGDAQLALIAVRTIKRGFYAASSFYTPGKTWISKCDAKISRLLGWDRKANEGPRGVSGWAEGSSSTRDMRRPSVLWSFILEIGFLGWIGSAIGFIMSAFRSERKARFWISPAAVWGGLTLTFFALWLVGMMKA
jgi:hypothetical protein